MNFEEEAIKVVEQIAQTQDRDDIEADDISEYDIIAAALEDAYDQGYAKASEPEW